MTARKQGISQIEIESLRSRFEEVYYYLRQRTIDVFKANNALIEAEKALEEATDAILVKYADDPKALGSSEVYRKAKIAEMTVNEREEARQAERAVQLAKHNVEIARLDVEAARANLRCVEAIISLNT
jgi:nicotinamide mononucleotide adenylyltransferase